jgi:hypothetical protein
MQCSQIQCPALNAQLPKLHLNHNTARHVHGPTLYGGMSLPHLHTCQGISQLKFLLGHLRATDKTCKLILIAHGYLQLLIGISVDFLNASYATCHHWACKSWFTSVWWFLDKLHLTITMHQAWIPPSLQGHDVNLMDYFILQQLPLKHLYHSPGT